MSSTKRHITNLTKSDIEELTDGWKNGKSHVFRNRCHCILMSFNGQTVQQLMVAFSVSQQTIYAWLDRWQKGSLKALHDQPGRGRKPLVSLDNKQHAKIVGQAVRNAFEKGTDIREEIIQKTQLKKSFSKRTLSRLLKKKDYVWKRLRRQTKKQPPEQEKKDLLENLSWGVQLAIHNHIDLFFVDESGFSLQPKVSYAWQPKGIQWAIESSKSKLLNVLGFLNPTNNHLVSYFLPEKAYMNSDLFISYVDDFCTKITRETALVLDRATFHTSAAVQAKWDEWEQKDLHIFYLPTYSPHLNLIETLWRKVKHEWLSRQNYKSEKTLKKKLKEIFKSFGKNYNIEFSMSIFDLE